MPQYYTLVGSLVTKLPDEKPHNVMIATPTSRGFCPAYTLSLAATIETLVRSGIRYTLELLADHCHVDDARNNIIRKFLRSDCTDLFFIDSDMGWRGQDVIRLLKKPGDIVAGVYRYKSDDEGYPFHPGEGAREANEDGLFWMPKAATGFMRIRRNVVQALYDAEVAKGRRSWSKGDDRQNDIPLARVVERAFLNELDLSNLDISNLESYHSGDYVLCLKARQLGFDVFVDVDMPFEHVGEKVWKGHAGQWLRYRQGIENEAFMAAIKSLHNGDASLGVFQSLISNSPLPAFAAPARVLKAAWEMACDAEGPILECGSGLSTLVMGIALTRKKSPWAVYTLENDLNWVKRVGTWLQRYSIENIMLSYSPLVPYERGNWYDADPSNLPETFDGVLVDGPPRVLNQQIISERSVLWDALGGQIAGARTWVIDDISTPHEKRVIQQYVGNREIEWLENLPDNKVHAACVVRKHEVAIAAE
jgi:hypothetical protein